MTRIYVALGLLVAGLVLNFTSISTSSSTGGVSTCVAYDYAKIVFGAALVLLALTLWRQSRLAMLGFVAGGAALLAWGFNAGGILCW